MAIDELPKLKSTEPTPLWKIFSVASTGAGVNFGWALQLSLLTPYIQQLGVSHAMTSLVWLCGPISSILIQPTVGYLGDRSKCKFGRRKPFITVGTILICIGVLLIGFAADIGHHLGDDLNHKTKPRAVAFFVIGFWILDIANNMVQGPSRAFLGDLSRGDHRMMNLANGLYSFSLAIGDILGYAAGSMPLIFKALPFTNTSACDTSCANLKTCFLFQVVFISVLVAIPMTVVAEPEAESFEDDDVPFCAKLKTTIKNIGRPMRILFIVTALNWIAWFAFLVYKTDWVGVELYGGNPQGNALEKRLYQNGVRSGALGLVVTAITLAIMSLTIDPLSRFFGDARKTWGLGNFLLAAILFATLPLTKLAERARRHKPPGTLPDNGLKAAVLAHFALTGVSEAATYSIPFAMASMFSSDAGAGQGLALGLINLAISIPQMLMAIISGPFDALFGGGNLPAFLLGSVSAFISGVLALTILPPTNI